MPGQQFGVLVRTGSFSQRTNVRLVAAVTASLAVASLVAVDLPSVANAEVAKVAGRSELKLAAGDLDATPGRPDSISAMVTARASGVRVEDVSQRTSDTRTYAMPDGTWNADTYSDQVFVHDGDLAEDPGIDGTGAWHEIDTTLVHRGGGWRPAHSNTEVVFSDGGDAVFAQLTTKGHEVSYGLGGDGTNLGAVTLPAPVVDGDTIVYPDIIPEEVSGVNLVARATTSGFTHWLILTERPTTEKAAGLSFPVTLTQTGDGGDLRVTKQATGALVVTDERDKTVVSAPAPIAWDATNSGPDDSDPARQSLKMLGKPAPPAAEETELAPSEFAVPLETAVRNDVELGIAPNDADTTTSVIDLSTAPEFLTSPDTVYPVTIDPSDVTGTTGDTWAANADYTGGQPSSTELRVGTNDSGGHKYRSFVRFSTSKWTGKNVLSASLLLRNFDQASCTAGNIQVGRINTAWDPATMTWGNQPSAGGTGANELGVNSNCPTNGSAAWDVTAIARLWAYGTNPQLGLRVMATNETYNATYRRYRSANYTDDVSIRPHINFSYNTFPATAGTPVVTTSPASSAGYSRSATPTLSAKVSDPDGSNVRAQFEVFNSAGTRVWVGSSPYVASGGTATLKVGTALADGLYTARALTFDGTNNTTNSSGTALIYSPTKSFTVDTTAPSVNITASGFTNGQWTVTPPPSSTSTLDGSPDAASIVYTIDGGIPTTKVPNASGDYSFAWLPTVGSHTLTAWAADRAGNTGTPRSFNFGVGAPALDTVSQPSTGTFPLQIDGPPNTTGVTLSWRYSGYSSDSWRTLTGVTTSAGVAWSGSAPNSSITGLATTPDLVWDATMQEDSDSTPTNLTYIDAPASVEVRGCFGYAGTSPACSAPQKLQLVPAAFGGNFPVSDVGPASIALFTGELSLSEPDAVDSSAGVGRKFGTFDPSTLSDPISAGVFGPGWSANLISSGDTDANIVDHRAKDGSLVLVAAGGGSQIYLPLRMAGNLTNPTQPVTFKPAGVDDGSRMTLDPTTDPETVVLTEPLGAGSGGATTTWNLSSTGATPEWEVVETAPSADAVDDPAVVVTRDAASRLSWIAQSEPGEAVTCTEAVQTAGCRGLKINYLTLGSGSSAVQRVSRIDRLLGTGTGVTTTTLATYTYTSSAASALLQSVCGGDPDGAATTYSPLCSTYEYDTTSVASRTLLKKYTPPGQKAWEFNYDSRGKVTSISRAIDTTDTSGSGAAVWRFAYDIDPATSGLPDLGKSEAARWGQMLVPLRAAAIYTPEDGLTAAPTMTDLPKASLYYYDIGGATTNTAVHGNTTLDGTGAGEWLVDTNWFDEWGNTVRTLDAAARADALASSSDANIQSQTASLLANFTIYNADGTRVEDEYGPAHTSTLQNGNVGTYRSHTKYIYDGATDGAHSSSTLGGSAKPPYPVDADDVDGDGNTTELLYDSFDLVVEERRSAADPAMTSDQADEHDVTITRNDFAPIVQGDGNGWNLGKPTRSSTQLADGSWVTAVTRLDSDGFQVETRQPGGGATTSGAGSDAKSYSTTYFASDSSDSACTTLGHPERATWAGLVCKTGPATQPAGVTVPVTTHTYDDNLRPLVTTETSGSTTRTTTHAYDLLGRLISTTIATSGSGATGDVRKTTIGYSPTSGMAISASDTGSTGVSTPSTVTSTFDQWGRSKSYTDATGMTASTTYTAGGRTATFSDGVSTYTYTYATAGGEERGLVSTVDAGLASGVADTFTFRYDAASTPARVTYPNGTTADFKVDEAGNVTALDYTAAGASEPLLGFEKIADVEGRAVGATSVLSDQSYTYDQLGRLTAAAVSVTDVSSDKTTCTTRKYSFESNSSRTNMTSFGPAVDGSCQTATASSSRAYSYDTGSRITNSGYVYDTLGRNTTVPVIDTNAVGMTGASALSAAYYANDRIKGLAQTLPNGSGGTVARQDAYSVDPSGRVSTVVTSENSVEKQRVQYRYAGDSDSPAVVRTSADAGATWTSTRYIRIPGFAMVATVVDGAITLQLSNIHGDVVATQTMTTSIGSYTESDEYGNSVAGKANARYGWHGANQRASDVLGGLKVMGVRLYNPATGQFLSMDPVQGGNSTPYAYPQDPINFADLDGAEGKFWQLRRHSVTLATCASFGAYECGQISMYTKKIKKKFTGDTDYGNFERHFIWMVTLCFFVSCTAAHDMGWAHEYGLLKHGSRAEKADTKRDRANNKWSIAWYKRNIDYVRRCYKTAEYKVDDFWELMQVKARMLWNDGKGYRTP
jgi:RHS repeat-associated protein